MSFSNGYTNGSYRNNRYEEPQEESDPLGGSRQRRGAAYGMFYDGAQLAPAEPEAQPARPSFRRGAVGGSEISVSKKDTDGHNLSRSRDRGARGQNGAGQHGSGPGGRQIEGQSLFLGCTSTERAKMTLCAFVLST